MRPKPGGSSAPDAVNTLLTILEDDALPERAIEAAREIVGDFMQPQTGILFAVPVSATWGVPKSSAPRRAAANANEEKSGDTLLSANDKILAASTPEEAKDLQVLKNDGATDSL